MKFERIIALALLLGLLCWAASGRAAAAAANAAAIQVAAAADLEDDEEDEEEEAVDYRDRVREIQQWMNRRDSERKGEAPSLNIAPAAPPPAPFPKYFRDNGVDAGGYRKLDSDVRVRLRDAPEAGAAADDAPRHYSHSRWRRHVSPRISYRHHYHLGHSRHAHYDAAPAYGRHRGHAAHTTPHAHERTEARHAKVAAKPVSVKAKAHPAGKPASAKPAAKKGRSRR